LNPPAETVNHHLTGAGEFSTGRMGIFQPVLTVWVFRHPNGHHCDAKPADGKL
jgi:hypothetical protein